jgi:hypothetical protein
MWTGLAVQVEWVEGVRWSREERPEWERAVGVNGLRVHREHSLMGSCWTTGCRGPSSGEERPPQDDRIKNVASKCRYGSVRRFEGRVFCVAGISA